MITVFMGGTCNNSNWRDILNFQLNSNVNAFNPVVEDWNEEAQKNELSHRENDDYVLYCITPKMTGVYSIAEVIDDSNKRPEKTLFTFLLKDDKDEFDSFQLKSLHAVGNMVNLNGGKYFNDLSEVSEFLNSLS